MVKNYQRERKITKMALSKAKVREILSKAGVDAEHMQEALTEILDGNIASIEAVKEERDRYKENADKLPALQKELDVLKNNEGKSPYKVKYEALQEEMTDLKNQFDKYKADVTEKEVKAQKVDAYRKLLKETGVSEKRIDAVIKVSDIDKLKIDNEGNLEDKNELVKNIQSEWNDFIVTQSEQGAQTANPPQNTGVTKMTHDEIYKKDDHGRYVLSTAERQKALIENSKIN